MAPKSRVDKGKAPLVERESPPRRRPRQPGVVIRERQGDQPPREPLGQVPFPSAAQSTSADPTEEDVGPVEPEVRQPDQPEPSRGQTAAETGLERRMDTMMDMIAGVVQALQEVAQTQRRMLEQHVPQPTPVRARPADRAERRDEPVFEPRAASMEPVAREPPRGVPARSRSADRSEGFRDHARGPHGASEEPLAWRLDMRTFHHLRPPAFFGEHDFRVVESWIYNMEKVFRYLGCPAQHRVSYATYMLEADASSWWQTEQQKIPGGWETLTWEQFLDRFTRQYVPFSEKSRRATEFETLTQGRLTVEQYDQQFRALARFVEWAQPGSEAAARKFQAGLRPTIRRGLVAFFLTRYEDILERARVLEQEEEEQMKYWEKKRKAQGGDSQAKKRQATEIENLKGVRYRCG